MINLRNNYGWVVLLLVLGVIAALVNSWKLPVWEAKTKPVTSTTQTSNSLNQQPAPQQYRFPNTEDKSQDYATLTTEAIWKNLLSGFRAGKKAQTGLENALIERLQQKPDSPIYNELLSLFKQGGLDGYAQQIVVSILGEVGTYQSAQTLMRLVSDNLLYEDDVKSAAVDTISKFEPESWHDHPNTELAPLFESAWQTNDPTYWPAIANVMASIGKPSSLAIFNETLRANSDPERVAIVKQAMTNIANPALIPKLADSLEHEPSENVQWASGNALAHMGETKAAKALFNWSTQMDADKVNWATNWFETALNTTPGFEAYLEKNLSNHNFAAPEIKQAITSVLKELDYKSE